MKNIPFSYEENQMITPMIQDILKAKKTTMAKIRCLKQLKTQFSTSLAKSHADYHIGLLQQKISHIVGCMVRNLLLTGHGIFVAFRIYWYLYPEENWFLQNYGDSFTPTSSGSVFLYFYVLALIIGIGYFIFTRFRK